VFGVARDHVVVAHSFEAYPERRSMRVAIQPGAAREACDGAGHEASVRAEGLSELDLRARRAGRAPRRETSVIMTFLSRAFAFVTPGARECRLDVPLSHRG
jgi:hypothetical protein